MDAQSSLTAAPPPPPPCAELLAPMHCYLPQMDTVGIWRRLFDMDFNFPVCLWFYKHMCGCVLFIYSSSSPRLINLSSLLQRESPSSLATLSPSQMHLSGFNSKKLSLPCLTPFRWCLVPSSSLCNDRQPSIFLLCWSQHPPQESEVCWPLSAF